MRVPWNRGGLRNWLLVAAMAAAFAGHVTLCSVLLGTVLLFASMGMQFWSKGWLHQNREVTRSGPYRFVRHPFYLGNAVLDTGIVLMSGWWPLLVVAPVWWLLVYIPVMRREEARLKKLFGEEYECYMAHVPMFIPWRRPLPAAGVRFDWRNPNILQYEIPRALRYPAYPLGFVLIWHVLEYGSGLVASPPATFYPVVAAIVAFTACSAVWKKHFFRGRQVLPSWTLLRPARMAYLALIIVAGVGRGVLDPVDTPWLQWVPGMVLLVITVAMRVQIRPRPVVSEGMLALSLALLLTLWAPALLLVPWYLALTLDYRLSASRDAGVARFGEPGLALYLMIAALGVGAVLALELLPG